MDARIAAGIGAVALAAAGVGGWMLLSGDGDDGGPVAAERAAVATEAEAPATAQPEAPSQVAEAAPEPEGPAADAGPEAADADGLPFAADALSQTLGWMHGNCVAFPEPVAAGRQLTIVVLDGDDLIVRPGEIAREASDEGDCNLLDAQRRGWNEGYGFYVVEPLVAFEYGIAVLAPEGAGEGPDASLLDVDASGNGVDAFARCFTADGVRFSVFEAEAFVSDPLWQAEYQRDGTPEADCP